MNLIAADSVLGLNWSPNFILKPESLFVAVNIVDLEFMLIRFVVCYSIWVVLVVIRPVNFNFVTRNRNDQRGRAYVTVFSTKAIKVISTGMRRMLVLIGFDRGRRFVNCLAQVMSIKSIDTCTADASTSSVIAGRTSSTAAEIVLPLAPGTEIDLNL